MSLRAGPHKIVALHCGKLDYAEVEIDAPVHLIGPNNVGKTSLISLLQFLYLDDQRQMQFSRDMADTRRYYFPEKHSYALFECLTPTGFHVVGIHGLGPIRQHEFERFAYKGRIELADFLDEHRCVREPEDTFALLAVKGFTRLEPRHLRAALTGVGDGRGVHLGLVPARHSGTYERFRKVFGNILRLSHLRQDELKQLLLDVYSNDFQQGVIDLARHYASGFEQVKRDSHEVQALKLLQADIERLLRHLGRRDAARQVIPALWSAIGEVYTEQEAAFVQRDTLLQAAHDAIVREEADVKMSMQAAQNELRDLSGREAVLNQKFSKLEEQRQAIGGFEPDWGRQRRTKVQALLEELVIKLRHAAEEPLEQVRKRLRAAEQNLAAKRSQFENLAHAAVNHLRKFLKDDEIADAFSVLNPELLKLPLNGEQPGVRVPDGLNLVETVRELLAQQKGRVLTLRGVEIDLAALRSPILAEYQDPERIRQDIAALERDVRRYEETLHSAEQAESLRGEKTALEKENASLIREIAAYEAFSADLAHAPEWRRDLDVLRARVEALEHQTAECERRRGELGELDRNNRTERADVARQKGLLQDQRRSLPPPADAWPPQPLAEQPSNWDDLIARYRKAYGEEKAQTEQVRELMDVIEKRTYGRYTASDEAGTMQALRDQLDSIPQREKAVAEMWKGIAIGIKKDLQNIGRDLETLKGLVGTLNRHLAAVSISNLASLRLLIGEQPKWAKLIREITVDDELPLFSNPKDAEAALEGIGRLLADHPRVDLKDLFNLSFEVGTPGGKTYRHEHLDAIESNGTTTAIKVLVNLVLLSDLLGKADVQIPFYLDECSSLDQGNLAAIVNAARQMGFIAVLASPEAMDAADKLYFMQEQAGGRVVLDPKTALVRIQRDRPAGSEPSHA